MTTTPEDAHAGHATPGGQAAMVRDMRNRFWICFIFTVPILFYSPMGLFTPPQPPFGLKRNLWLFIFATLAIVYPSWPFFVSAWCDEHGVRLHHIQPGKPNQNAFIERFNRTYRTEVLDAWVFTSLARVREVTEEWLEMYNTERPHGSLGGVPPRTCLPRLIAV